jgi:hypothetical protein
MPTVRHFLPFPTTRMPYKLQENRFDHDSQEPQGFGKVPERSGTFCLRPDPNGHSFSRSGEQTLGQFSEPERVQSEADGIGVEVTNSDTLYDTILRVPDQSLSTTLQPVFSLILLRPCSAPSWPCAQISLPSSA